MITKFPWSGLARCRAICRTSVTFQGLPAPMPGEEQLLPAGPGILSQQNISVMAQ
jgi:hypothetical protein